TYASASLAGGLLTERFGRRAPLGLAAATLAIGLAIAGRASSWEVFLAAAIPMGAGAGAIDGGLNGLILAIVGTGRGRALNLLHLFFSLGALAAPFVVGRLVAGGAAWQLVMLATGVPALAVAGALALVSMPSGREERRSREEPSNRDSPPPSPARLGRLPRPLLFLTFAIACYVASEIGVSSWTVRFLHELPLETATLALSGFWAGLAVGRLAAAKWSDRFSHDAIAAAASCLAGIGVIVAVVSPSPAVSIAAIAIAGIGSGPVFPLIVAIGGELYPARVAAVAGTLTASAVLGGIVYPPLMGLMSESIGLAAGLLGAAALSMVTAGAILAATRVPRTTSDAISRP
ncbi:MAG TPA: MFS transporter, partial [Candidatus Limnocylindrales bacterium]|nr:MFS transporter [Candidatus Limnocylindrales bacterium]